MYTLRNIGNQKNEQVRNGFYFVIIRGKFNGVGFEAQQNGYFVGGRGQSRINICNPLQRMN